MTKEKYFYCPINKGYYSCDDGRFITNPREKGMTEGKPPAWWNDFPY